MRTRQGLPSAHFPWIIRVARAVASGVAFASAACAADLPEPAAGPVAEPADTGRDCATAKTLCGEGRCVAEIDNRCKIPITCKLSIESMCVTANGEAGPANATTNEITTLGSRTKTIEAETSCGQGTPVTTRVLALECI